MITLEIHAKPVSWKASQTNGKRHYNPRHLEKCLTQFQVKTQYQGSVISDYVVLSFYFYIPIPKSASKKKRRLMLSGNIIPTNIDTTNCQKFYEDCLKKIVILDDRYVSDVDSHKRYSETEKTVIKVYTLTEWRSKYENHS